MNQINPTIYTLNDVYKSSKQNFFNVISLFAGCGGSSTGYRLAGGNVLAINEFIEKAWITYKRNYPSVHVFKQDIRELSGNTILSQVGLKKYELDILDGSPPCVAFSSSGLKEKGWGKVKSYSDKEQRVDDLFYEYARILKEIMPKIFIAENVKGLVQGKSAELLGSNQLSIFGNHSDTIYHKLSDCGYVVNYKVLNAINFNVPQKRERIFIVGVRKDLNKVITFPKGNNNIITLDKAFDGIINTKDDLDEVNIERYEVYNHLLKMGIGKSFHNTRLLRKASPNKSAYTITASYGVLGGRCEHHWDNRKFTIKELIRISSFPEDYYLGNTYSEKAERIGRAVPPLLMKEVASHVYNTILKT